MRLFACLFCTVISCILLASPVASILCLAQVEPSDVASGIHLNNLRCQVHENQTRANVFSLAWVPRFPGNENQVQNAKSCFLRVNKAWVVNQGLEINGLVWCKLRHMEYARFNFSSQSPASDVELKLDPVLLAQLLHRNASAQEIASGRELTWAERYSSWCESSRLPDLFLLMTGVNFLTLLYQVHGPKNLQRSGTFLLSIVVGWLGTTICYYADAQYEQIHLERSHFYKTMAFTLGAPMDVLLRAGVLLGLSMIVSAAKSPVTFPTTPVSLLLGSYAVLRLLLFLNDIIPTHDADQSNTPSLLFMYYGCEFWLMFPTVVLSYYGVKRLFVFNALCLGLLTLITLRLVASSIELGDDGFTMGIAGNPVIRLSLAGSQMYWTLALFGVSWLRGIQLSSDLEVQSIVGQASQKFRSLFGVKEDLLHEGNGNDEANYTSTSATAFNISDGNDLSNPVRMAVQSAKQLPPETQL